MSNRTVVGLGGGGFSMEPENARLDDYILNLADNSEPRICFLPTASGDAPGYIEIFYATFPQGRAKATHLSLFAHDGRDIEEFLLSQDIIYVGGGNVMNMLAVWRVHELDKILREAYEKGIVLCGVSAGMLCWFEAMVTDSYGPQLEGRIDGLGLLKGSACPHYDGEALRRPRYHELIGGGFPAGYAADDGAALCFMNEKLHEVVSSRAYAGAYRVFLSEEGVVEEKIEARLL